MTRKNKKTKTASTKKIPPTPGEASPATDKPSRDANSTATGASTDSNIAVCLNTQADSVGRSEFTLLVKNDSVYVVNHLNNEIPNLSNNTIWRLLFWPR